MTNSEVIRLLRQLLDENRMMTRGERDAVQTALVHYQELPLEVEPPIPDFPGQGLLTKFAPLTVWG